MTSWRYHLQDPERQQLAVMAEIMRRDLEILAGEVLAMPEEHLWRVTGSVINPVGTLALHMCGNLQHFVGAVLGGTGYVRNREAEFGTRDMSRDEILQKIEETRTMLATVLPSLPSDRLIEVMPEIPARYSGRSVGFFLGHLCSHLAYHLGQVNYLRRVLAPGGGEDPEA
jgi:uncharacterized damage-inducible protein DinB